MTFIASLTVRVAAIAQPGPFNHQPEDKTKKRDPKQEQRSAGRQYLMRQCRIGHPLPNL